MFIGISIITFIMMYASGNPLQAILVLNPRMTPETKELLIEYYKLDQPIHIQYFDWLYKFVTLNMGTSIMHRKPVSDFIATYVYETLKLQFAALAISIAIAIPAGIYSARKQYTAGDYLTTTLSLFGNSAPTFWLGMLSIVFFIGYLKWIPSTGAHSIEPSLFPFGSYFLDEIRQMLLPTLILAFINIALYARLMRSSMLEVLRQDYILAARASGLKESTVIYKHAMRNAILPVITFLGIYIASALGGAPITETVFSWPGLGRGYIEALNNFDYPVIVSLTMVLTVVTLLGNLVVDIVYGFIDPRIRIE